MLLGLWGMWRRRSQWRDDSLIYGLFGSFVLVTAVFFGDTSHRSYLDVYWIVFGAGVLARRHSRSPSALSPATGE
jgi:O-antigen ligase